MFDAAFSDSQAISAYISDGEITVLQSDRSSSFSIDDVETKSIGLTYTFVYQVDDDSSYFFEIDGAKTSIRDATATTQEYGPELTYHASSDGNGDGGIRYSGVTGLKFRWFSEPGHYASAYFGFERQSFDVETGFVLLSFPLPQHAIFPPSSTFSFNEKRYLFGIGTEHVTGFGLFAAGYAALDTNLDQSNDTYLPSNPLLHPDSQSVTGEGRGDRFTLLYAYQLSPSFDIYLNRVRDSIRYSDVFATTNFTFGSETQRLSTMKITSDTTSLGFRFVF